MKNYVEVILYIDSLSGNPHLEKWSATSLRRAGLCADHFSDNSFNKEGKKKLKRGSVPFPFKNNALPNSSNEDVEINNIPMAVEVTEIENAIGNVTETKKKNENVTRPTTCASVDKNKNNDIIEQSFQLPSLRTYRSPQLDFNMVSEKEDDLEWINVEPPINKKKKNNAYKYQKRTGKKRRK